MHDYLIIGICFLITLFNIIYCHFKAEEFTNFIARGRAILDEIDKRRDDWK